MKKGLIIGKFMPVHAGHLHLFDQALLKVDQLNVILFWNEEEPIPGKLRLEWLKKLRPNINFYECTDRHEIDFNSDKAWRLWSDSIRKLCPEQQDYVFSSENYGFKLAQYLGAEAVQIDPMRVQVPISATQIRNKPFQYWDYIPHVVKPYFVKKICICGGESTGKTTLAKQLGEYFKTICVPEFAREYLIKQNGKCSIEDMLIIAEEQYCREEEAKKSANKFIFCDTNAITTKIWSEYYFGSCDPRIEELIQKYDVDLYLLAYPDIPWVPDGLRDSQFKRDFFLQQFKLELSKNTAICKNIYGYGFSRLENSLKFINQIFS